MQSDLGQGHRRHATAANHMLVPPSQGRSAMQVVTSHKPPSPCFHGEFLSRRSTPRKCESRGKCLKDNATCAQNAILAVSLLPRKLIVCSSGESSPSSFLSTSSRKEGQGPRVRDPWCPQS